MTHEEIGECLRLYLEAEEVSWEQLAEDEGVDPVWLESRCRAWDPYANPPQPKPQQETPRPRQPARIDLAVEAVLSGRMSFSVARKRFGAGFDQLRKRLIAEGWVQPPPQLGQQGKTSEAVKQEALRLLASGSTVQQVADTLGLGAKRLERDLGLDTTMTQRIINALRASAEPLTVAQIAEAVELDRARVGKLVAAARRTGQVVDVRQRKPRTFMAEAEQ